MSLNLLKVIWVIAALQLWAPIAAAQEVWSVGQGEIGLKVSEAKFIKLDRPAKAVFLSDPSVAEVDLQSARYLYLVGRAVGRANLFVLGENDEEIVSTTIAVDIDAEKLARAARLATGGDEVAITAVDGAVFLRGRVKSETDASTAGDVVSAMLGDKSVIVNLLEIDGSPQVNLQVRIAEVSRSVSEDLGLSLNAASGNGLRSFNAPRDNLGGFSVSIGSGSRNINLVLDALARRGLVSILSEPNLTARSGEAATFLAGGRIPYPIKNSDGEISYQMEPIGVELDFTPTVYGSEQIRLEIKTRVRGLDGANSTTDAAPALKERSATTTVELGSGQSFAIAGMFQSDSSQSITGFPGLSALPVVGALFRSSRYARGETELVIIVTPYLVAPTQAQLRSPQDRVELPQSGGEQMVTGQLHRPVQTGAPATSRARRGGFILP